MGVAGNLFRQRYVALMHLRLSINICKIAATESRCGSPFLHRTPKGNEQ
jgi:hypothetical protein